MYGYASTEFDAVAKGQYLIQGMLMIPFREVGFLYAVQKTLSQQSAVVREVERALRASGGGATKIQAETVPQGADGRSPRAAVTTRVGETEMGEAQTQTIVSTLTPEDVLTEEAQAGGRSFHDLVEALQSSIWDTPGPTTERVTRPDLFDLDPSNHFVQTGFNILVTFGDPNNPQSPSTVKSLIDVHLTDDRRTINMGGDPVYEQYSFFARSSDENLGAYRVVGSPPPTPVTDPSAGGAGTPPPASHRAGFDDPGIEQPGVPAKSPAEQAADRIITQSTREFETLVSLAQIPPVRSTATTPNVTGGAPPPPRLRKVNIGGGVEVEVTSDVTMTGYRQGRYAPTAILIGNMPPHPFHRGDTIRITRAIKDTDDLQWYYCESSVSSRAGWIPAFFFQPIN